MESQNPESQQYTEGNTNGRNFTAESIGGEPHQVLLFEDMAHEPQGHYPHLFAQIARGLAAEGHEVHVLTSKGWALNTEDRSLAGVATVHCMPRLHRSIAAMANQANRLQSRFWARVGRRPDIGTSLMLATIAVHQVTLVSAIRHTVKKFFGNRQIPVVVLSVRLQFFWAVLLAPRQARWVVQEYFAPPGARKPERIRRRIAVWLASKREHRRRVLGGHVRLAANNDGVLEDWRRHCPWLEGDVVPTAAWVPKMTTAKKAARQQLGILLDGPLALHFGEVHKGKDLKTILKAYWENADLGHIVIAGVGAAEQCSAWQATKKGAPKSPIRIIEGYVSEVTKHLLYSAADFAVLSFRADTQNDSGTLSDAIAYGLPVCCSDTGTTAQLVRTYRLGVLFAAANSTALADAVRAASNFSVDPKDHSSYFQNRSPVVVGKELLALASRSSLPSRDNIALSGPSSVASSPPA